MNSSNITVLLNRLGCSKVKDGGSWVYSSCPLAPYTHSKARDEHPSFSVAVDQSGVSGCRCHACHFDGSLLALVWKLASLSHTSMDEVVEFVRLNNGPTLSSIATSIKKKHAEQAMFAANPEKAPKVVPWDPEREVAGIKGVQLDLLVKLGDKNDLPLLPENALSSFVKPQGEVLEYLLNDRHLSREMLEQWDIRWDSYARRIVIPVWDCKKRLVGYSRRAFDDGVKPKYMHADGFKRDFYLYGEHLWEPGQGGACHIVEGFFDVKRLVSYGYRCGAVMGSYLSDFQLEKIVRFFDRVVIVPDGDKPGYDAADLMFKRISPRLPTHIVHTPVGMDPDDFTRDFAVELLGAP